MKFEGVIAIKFSPFQNRYRVTNLFGQNHRYCILFINPTNTISKNRVGVFVFIDVVLFCIFLFEV